MFQASLFKMLFTKIILIYFFLISTYFSAQTLIRSQIDLGFHCFYLKITWKIHGIGTKILEKNRNLGPKNHRKTWNLVFGKKWEHCICFDPQRYKSYLIHYPKSYLILYFKPLPKSYLTIYQVLSPPYTKSYLSSAIPNVFPSLSLRDNHLISCKFKGQMTYGAVDKFVKCLVSVSFRQQRLTIKFSPVNVSIWLLVA